MKKALFLLALLIIVFSNVKACPDGWAESARETINFNGCTYEYIYCYGMLNGFHSIALSEINVVYNPPFCTGLSFDLNPQEITDAILIQIAIDPVIYNWAGYDDIPPCPSGLMCIMRMYDAFCYNGWYTYTRLNKDGTTTVVQSMNKCDDELRSCNETVTICWEYDEYGNREYKITRVGSSLIGPECLYPCHTNCEY